MTRRTAAVGPAVRRARALEMLARGVRTAEVAKELKVTSGTVSRWAREARLAAAAHHVDEEVIAAQAELVERARETLAGSVDGAVATVIRLATGDIVGRDDAHGAKVQLAAALATLDRVGLHPRQAIEHDGSANTLTALVDMVTEADKRNSAR